jgi:hypothetical protein
MKRGRLSAQNMRQCLSADVPALIAMYRPTPNFVGQDSFIIEVTASDSKPQLQKSRSTCLQSARHAGFNGPAND